MSPSSYQLAVCRCVADLGNYFLEAVAIDHSDNVFGPDQNNPVTLT